MTSLTGGPHLLVGAVLLRDGAILLGKRAPTRAYYPGVWDVFGGHVEPHEAPEQALVRELQEELGITPTAFTKVAVIALAETGNAHPPERYEFHLYHVTEWLGTPENALVEEHSEIRWVPLDEVSQLELASPAYLPVFNRLAAAGIAP